MSIFRRRLMMGGKKPIEYLEFEDRRVWEICAYRWGYTQNIQEVGVAGGVLDEGVIEGNNDTMAYCDHIFAASYAIGAHGSVPATAARTVQYRVELYVNGSPSAAGAPWEIATPADATKPALYIVQYGTTMGTTVLKNITLESWDDASYWESQTDLTYNAEKECWECLVTVTNACQYLRIGLCAAAGVSVLWKVVSIGVTKIPQGITAAQCAAVSSFGTVFKKNTLIKQFNKDSTPFSSVAALNSNAFAGSTVEYVWLPYSKTIGTGGGAFSVSVFYNCKSMKALRLDAATSCNSVSYDSTVKYFVITTPDVPNASTRWMAGIIYVLDDLVDSYKSASMWSTKTIRPISNLPTDYPDCPWLDDLRDKGFII